MVWIARFDEDSCSVTTVRRQLLASGSKQEGLMTNSCTYCYIRIPDFFDTYSQFPQSLHSLARRPAIDSIYWTSGISVVTLHVTQRYGLPTPFLFPPSSPSPSLSFLQTSNHHANNLLSPCYPTLSIEEVFVSEARPDRFGACEEQHKES